MKFYPKKTQRGNQQDPMFGKGIKEVQRLNNYNKRNNILDNKIITHQIILDTSRAKNPHIGQKFVLLE